MAVAKGIRNTDNNDTLFRRPPSEHCKIYNEDYNWVGLIAR